MAHRSGPGDQPLGQSRRRRARRDSAGLLRGLAHQGTVPVGGLPGAGERHLTGALQRAYDEGYAAALAWVQDELETVREKYEAEYQVRIIPF